MIHCWTESQVEPPDHHQQLQEVVAYDDLIDKIPIAKERNTAKKLNGFLRIRGSRRQVNTEDEKLMTMRSLRGIKVKANKNTNVIEEHIKPLNSARNIFFNVFLTGITLSSFSFSLSSWGLLSFIKILKIRTWRAPLTKETSPADSSPNLTM